MTISERIRYLRKIVLKMNQTQFAEQIGLGQTSVSTIEKKVSSVPDRTIMNICNAFGASEHWLRTGEGAPLEAESTTSLDDLAVLSGLTRRERLFLQKFMEMPRKARDGFLDFIVETAHALDSMQDLRSHKPPKDEPQPDSLNETPPQVVPFYRTIMYMESVSAGTGSYVDSATKDTIDLLEPPPQGTSFVLRVTGDSMVPRFQPGDLVYVQEKSDLSYGQIGIFSINGEMFIKKYTPEGLESLNPDYETIRPTTDILCQGLVLGTVPESALPQE